jgi:hypothetical protein
MNDNVLSSGVGLASRPKILKSSLVCFEAFYCRVNISSWQVSIFLKQAFHCIPSVGEDLLMRPMTFVTSVRMG